jgi:hypothetical protein
MIASCTNSNRVCVAGALRLYYSILTDKSPDTSWEGFYLWTWESIEINLGIVCASAPCLKSLITRIVPKLFSSNPSTNLPSFSTTGNDRFKRFGMGETRDGGGRGYALSEVVVEGVGDRESSRDDWTDGREFSHECVLVANVDAHNMSSSVLSL